MSRRRPYHDIDRCGRCQGRGYMRVRTFKWCRAVPCVEHVQHFYRKRCWLCFGSGWASVVVIAWRHVCRIARRVAS